MTEWPHRRSVDSLTGITVLINYARDHGFVLDGRHEKIAKKYGVDTTGVIFARPIPIVDLDK